MQAKDIHLAVFIDHTTNVKNVAELRPEIRYWQERLTGRTAPASQILLFVRRLVDALHTIPGHRPDSLVGPDPVVDAAPFDGSGLNLLTPMPASRIKVGQYSLAAARALLWYFVLTPYKPLRNPTEEGKFLDIGSIIEMCLGLERPLRALRFLEQVERQLRAGSIEEIDVRRRMCNVGVLFDQMPHYEDMREETKLLV